MRSRPGASRRLRARGAPLSTVLPDARDRHRVTPSLPERGPEPPRETTPYRLPDGQIVRVFEDVARGAATVTFQLAVGGRVVNAVRLPEED